MAEIVLRHAENTAEIAACFQVMALLRPHLANADPSRGAFYVLTTRTHLETLWIADSIRRRRWIRC